MRKLGQKLAILGGGQLARMLVIEAHRLGLEPYVYSSSLMDPACQVLGQNSQWAQGELSDIEKIQKFLKGKDYLTFESEFVPHQTLDALPTEEECFIFPKPMLLQQLQKRSEQKKILQKYKVPTLDFIEIKHATELDQAWQKLGPFVLKSQLGGYDGYGTFYARQFADLPHLASVVANASQKFIAEPFAPFKRELAVILVRSKHKKIIAFPIVQTQQTQSRCDWVMGPIKHPAFPAMLKRLEKMLHALDYVGAMGVEFFDLGKSLLVNEIAPRVHNSGHYSQDALVQDQFCLHLKAGLGDQLTNPILKSNAFVMTNLLGESESQMQAPAQSEGHLHWYGKNLCRPGRKMGHVNYLGKNAKSLLALALKERKKWQK